MESLPEDLYRLISCSVEKKFVHCLPLPSFNGGGQTLHKRLTVK